MLSPLAPMDIARQYTLELVCALLAIPILLSTGLAVRRLLVNRYRVPLGIRYKIACAALSVHLPLFIYQWAVESQFAAAAKTPADVAVDGAAAPVSPFLFSESLLQALLSVTILFCALTLAQLVRKYFWDEWFEKTMEAEAPKFLSDIGSACIVGLSLVLIATGVYHKDLSGLELGSTVSVAVLGFASQDLLGNLLSGIALQIGSPFKKGDWLLINSRRLQVQEVNWRSTRMRSSENVLVDVPNKTIAGGTIINLSAPTAERALRIVVGFDQSAPPEEVKECLLSAARTARKVLSTPAPRAVLKDFSDTAIRYELVFWVPDEDSTVEASDSVQTTIWHAAKRSGLKLAAAPLPSPTPATPC
jgi:small-conductance mechanosensitive channel